MLITGGASDTAYRHREETMKPFAIYVDSGANIPNDIRIARDIRVIPFHYIMDGREYPCFSEEMPFEETAKQFYDAMRAGAEAKTSLLTPAVFEEALRPALEEGRDVLLFTISSGVSGTFAQAQAAAKQLMQEFPARKVYALDSANASLGEGLIALRVADLRDLGESAETCAAWVREHAYEMNSFLTVEDLKYLRRSGRISRTVAIAGTLLNIKPILKADESENAKIVACGKARGRKKALGEIADIFAKRVVRPAGQTVAIAHGDCKEDAEYLASLLRAHGVEDIIIEYYDLCTGSHAGPGTVALFFWGQDRRAVLPEREKLSAAAPVTHKA